MNEAMRVRQLAARAAMIAIAAAVAAGGEAGASNCMPRQPVGQAAAEETVMGMVRGVE